MSSVDPHTILGVKCTHFIDDFMIGARYRAVTAPSHTGQGD